MPKSFDDFSIFKHHLEKYPLMQIQDIIKLIYQQALGSGHLAPSFKDTYYRVESERNQSMPTINLSNIFEPIGNSRFRLHLNAPGSDLIKTETIANLFLMESEKEAKSQDLIEILNRFKIFAKSFFSSSTYEKNMLFINKYKNQNCPPLSHSKIYKENYYPSYRIVGSRASFFQELLFLIEKSLYSHTPSSPYIVAIDGRSASGKSSLASWLQAIYPSSTILHMDDYFLPQALKTQERLSIPGENIDHERFKRTLLDPIRQNKPAHYQSFCCKKQALNPAETLEKSSFYIVEGSYSMHPKLLPFYNATVFLSIPSSLQTSRIRNRNGKDMLPMFTKLWIPLEEEYFSAYNTNRLANLKFDTSAQSL